MLKVNALSLPCGGSIDTFQAGGVQFRNQLYVQAPTYQAGEINSKVGIISFWLKRGYWGQEEWIFNFAGNWCPCWIGADDKINFAATDTSGTINCCYITSSNVIPQDMRWHHYAFAFSLGTTNVTQLYIDGISRRVNTTVPSNTTIAWAGHSFLLGRRYESNANYLFSSLAEFYLNTKEFLDLSVASNLAKFRDPSSGKPVNLGPDGSWVTGSKPLIYLRHDPANSAVTDFRTNLGSGAQGGLYIQGGDWATLYPEPQFPSSPWTNVYDTISYWDASGWAGYTIREVILAANIKNVPPGQTQVRVTVASDPRNGNYATWGSMYIGHQTGPEAAAVDLTQLYFDGSAGGTCQTSSTRTSDVANWKYNGTSKVILTVYFTSAGGLAYGYNPGAQGYYATGDYSAYLATSGYTALSAQRADFFKSIEMM